MRKQRAALGSAVFFLAAPCIVAGVLPWWISGWSRPAVESWLAASLIVSGVVIGLAGLTVLLRAFARFVNEGVPLVIYALATWSVMAAFVRSYEEPILRARFGDQYEQYRASVRAWWPRLRPWPAGRPDRERD